MWFARQGRSGSDTGDDGTEIMRALPPASGKGSVIGRPQKAPQGRDGSLTNTMCPFVSTMMYLVMHTDHQRPAKD
jgi:hypothetical protein